MGNQMNDHRETLLCNLDREEDLGNRLKSLKSSHTGNELSSAREAIPTSSGDFEDDLRDLVTIRDRLLQNIQSSGELKMLIS